MKDKVVIITGASSGIGAALAEAYVAHGAKVMLAARRADKLKEMAQKLQDKGGEAHWWVTDVADRTACEAMVAATVEHFGQIDVLINNAGISMRALATGLDASVIEKVVRVNFFGTVYCTQAALPHLILSKGSIIGVSSIAGFRGLPGRTGYSASKFAMHGYLESLRTELLKTGVHVLVACPGFTASNIRKAALVSDGSAQGDTPLKEDQLMMAEEVAGRIYRAQVRRKRTLVLTRQGKMTVLLNKLFPGFMDKMVYNHFAKEPDSPLK
ncbi:MAG: SDR family oxidoreductase [Bacteroidota bacterium]